MAGSECVAGVCRAICDPQGGLPKCDALHACITYEGMFESGHTTVAGVCEPTCDPLTQARADLTPACGSLDPASPDRGCFARDLDDFACLPASATTWTHTDRVAALAPSNAGAYVNGCAPGFVPLLRESTGSTEVACAGLCAPLPTDNTLAGNALGDALVAAKLPREAAAEVGNATCEVGKKGSEVGQQCLFLWPFRVVNGTSVPSAHDDTLGICFAAAHYRYDHDGDAGTPDRDVPQCSSLPAKGTIDPGPDGTADQWGCYRSADTEVDALHPALGDFRAPIGGRAALPHALD